MAIFSGWPAIFASLLGGYVGLYVTWGVSTFNLFLVACVGYVILEKLAEKLFASRLKTA